MAAVSERKAGNRSAANRKKMMGRVSRAGIGFADAGVICYCVLQSMRTAQPLAFARRCSFRRSDPKSARRASLQHQDPSLIVETRMPASHASTELISHDPITFAYHCRRRSPTATS